MSLDLYPEIVYEGDLSPDAFGEEVDEICNEIKEACEGWGTDEDRLLKAMGSQNADTRCKVPMRYNELFEKDLKAVMKSECGSRDFGTALQLLAVDPVTAECDIIQKACKGLGTNELLLYSILCGRSNRDMELLKKKYFDLFTEDLGQVVASELGGDLEKLVINVMQASEEEFDPDYHTEDKVAEDIEKLYEMGQGSWGTDEQGLFKILCASPPEYLTMVNLAYAEKYGYTLMKVLEKELGGQVKDAALFTLGMKVKPYETVAKLIDTACRGFGTNELLLTCTLIRYQSIMSDVMAAHAELYGTSLEERVESEVGGDYKKVLLEVLKV